MNQMSRQFASAVLKRIGAPITMNNIKFLVAWGQAEGTKARYNPLATTHHMPGATSFNSVGVRNFRSFGQGVEGTARALENGLYGPILTLMRSGTARPQAMAAAVAQSPWGTHEGVLRVLGSGPVQVPNDPSQPAGGSVRPRVSRAGGPPPTLSQAQRFSLFKNVMGAAEGGTSVSPFANISKILSDFRSRSAAPPGFSPPPGVTGPPVTSNRLVKGEIVLPTHFKSTHDTDGIDGYQPSIDITTVNGHKVKPWEPVGAPEDGIVFRHGSAQGGQALYLRGRSGRIYWIGHLTAMAKVGTRVRKGQVIAHVSPHHAVPHVHIGILSASDLAGLS